MKPVTKEIIVICVCLIIGYIVSKSLLTFFPAVYGQYTDFVFVGYT